MSKEVWVLGDYRKGNTNQAIALAEELGLSFELKMLKYNLFCKLPNLLLNLKPIHIGKDLLESLTRQAVPQLIISAGRRAAPIALYLKHKAANKPKVVQIMKPGIAANLFDLLVLPQHDNFNLTSSNVVRIIGALTNIADKLPEANEELRKNYPEVKNFISILLGGDSRNYKYSIEQTSIFVQRLISIAENYNGSLFISFSRRTPIFMKQLIKEKFSWPHIIYDPEEQRTNPYVGMLGGSDYIITTADSISMCSEVASTGKPFYIFCPKDFNLNKHRFFIQQLFDLGIARNLDDSVNYLSSYQYTPLNEVKAVADHIKSELLI